jgi:hypothetical protein
MNRVIPPWELSGDGSKEFEALAGHLIDRSFSSVHYRPLSGGKWPDGHRHDQVHEIDMAVVFVLVSGDVLEVRWEMQGLNEGLGVRFSAADNAQASDSGDLVDVSRLPEWHPLLGVPVVGVSRSRHVPNEGCPEALWALRFDFSSGASAVLALGEMDGDHLGYLPDGLVAIFDEAEARSYRIQSSRQSAWCEWVN